VRDRDALHNAIPGFNAVLKRAADSRRAGPASLDLAHVACGRLDGYWEYGLQEWDIAAGALIVQESGGLVGDPLGRENHLESGNVVAGNPKIFRQLLEVLAQTRATTV